MRHFAILTVLIISNFYFIFVVPLRLSIVTDKEALLSFKSNIDTKPPNPLSTWNQTLSPCNWTGIQCNKLGERVIGLDLASLKLEGSISSAIGNLSFLRSLKLQNNQLTGKFPYQIGNLFRLRELNMSFNSLEGQVPRNLSLCAQLRTLDLMANRISGAIPEEISSLTKLQVLNLGRNHLSGTIPPSIANLSSLTNLNLGTNALVGMVPHDLARLQNLKVLHLSVNNLTGTVPPSIYNMSSLVHLALAANNLWGGFPNDLGVTLPNLLFFIFCFNKFTGNIPGSLHNLTNIQVIRMSYNLLQGTVPPGLGNLPMLQTYNIGFNRIVSSGDDGLKFLTLLANSTRLEYLAIDSNLLEGVIPESVGNLSTVLAKLYMGENRIYGNIPASIGSLKGLALLNVSCNSVSGEIPQEIGQLGDLQVLDLAGNNLSGVIPTSVGDLRKLISLDLSRNELVENIPTSFRNLQNLLWLDLSYNKLNGSIPREVLNLPSLSTYLNLSNNFLSGPLSEEVGMLDGVITIEISNNNITGSIPESIENCKSLEQLLMANNKLSGHIPETLGMLKGLANLDISSNRLSGPIPQSLEKLQALQLLNLSFNDLEGQVPHGGIFKNRSKFHLEGNPKLCFKWPCKKSHNSTRRVIWVCMTVTFVATIGLCFTITLFFFFHKEKGKLEVESASESVQRQHQMVSYDELRLATGDFNSQNLVGTGSFGSVYRGYLREGTIVAVKVLNTEITGSWKSFLAECAALRNVRHRNLVKLKTSCSSIDFRGWEFLALVYEYMSNGSLEDWIFRKKRHEDGQGLGILDRLSIAIDVASAINYLHHESGAPQVVHCDIKPSNILLDEEKTAKVGDFGLAKLLLSKTSDQPSISSVHSLKGSIGYIPPEYGLGEKPSTAGDVYSFGITLLELFTGKRPTDESFTGGLNLRKWVEMSLPGDIKRVVDPDLWTCRGSLGREVAQSTNPEELNHYLVAILGIGLSCTVDSPDGRTSIIDVLSKLKVIRDAFQT